MLEHDKGGELIGEVIRGAGEAADPCTAVNVPEYKFQNCLAKKTKKETKHVASSFSCFSWFSYS